MTLEQDFYDILYRSRSTFVEEKNYIENFKANSASALFLWSNWCERLCLQLLHRIKSNFGHLQIKRLRSRAVAQLIEREIPLPTSFYHISYFGLRAFTTYPSYYDPDHFLKGGLGRDQPILGIPFVVFWKKKQNKFSPKINEIRMCLFCTVDLWVVHVSIHSYR